MSHTDSKISRQTVRMYKLISTFSGRVFTMYSFVCVCVCVLGMGMGISGGVGMYSEKKIINKINLSQKRCS